MRERRPSASLSPSLAGMLLSYCMASHPSRPPPGATPLTQRYLDMHTAPLRTKIAELEARLRDAGK